MADSHSDLDWASLPNNVLDTILDRLVALSDYVHFSEVCKPWSAVALHQKRKWIVSSSKKGLPRLLQPSPVFDASGRIFYPYRRRYCGSSHGWVATVDENLVITLSKPYSSASTRHITLPSVGEREVFGIPFWYDYMIKKVVLSDDPDLFPDQYEVVVIFGLFRSLAVIKSGQKTWSYRTNSYSNSYPFLFSDVIYYRGKLYASETKMSCGLLCFDPVSNSEQLRSYEVVKKCLGDELDLRHVTYLVESTGGDLMLVERFLATEEEEEEDEGYSRRPMTVHFKVSKLSGEEWVEVESIGDDVMFLGDSESLCVSAVDYGGGGCKRNCIYYSDDQTDVPLYTPCRDMGVYCLENGSFDELDPNQHDMPPSIWVLRKLQRC